MKKITEYIYTELIALEKDMSALSKQNKKEGYLKDTKKRDFWMMSARVETLKDIYKIVQDVESEYNKFFKTLNKDSKLIFNFVLQYWNIHTTIDVIKTLTPLAVNETTVPVMIEPLEYPKFMAWNILPEEYIKKIIPL